MKSSINKFSKGLIQDVSDINESNQSYKDSMNGSLIYNDNGNFDWVVGSGNKLSFSILPDSGTDPSKYVPIGAIGDNNVKVIFSVYEAGGLADIRSEIGLFSSDEKGVGTYKTLFNDRAVVGAANRLNFKSQNQIEARFLYENDNTIRVYWVDGVEEDSNSPRVFTFKYDGGGKGNANNYSAVTSSVHAINSQPKHSIGILFYNQRVSGNLKTGVYQYSYRCITADGYASPWTTPSRRSFLTSDSINSTNWNLYEMEGSGDPSSYGNRITIKGLDGRYEFVEIAYLYSETKDITSEVKIFTKEIIPANNNITVDHTSMTGTPIIAETIASSFVGIRAAKTLDIKDSTLYYGNIIESVDVFTDAEKESIFANMQITPLFKKMRSDELDSENKFAPPLTHQNPKASGTYTKSLNQVENLTYDVVNDYVNYKGTQVDKEFSGYWRGETYRFALVAHDDVGIPLFALHLADFKFPEQTGLTYSWERLQADGVTKSTFSGTLAEYPWLTDNYGDTYAGNAGDDLYDQDSTDPIQNISKIRIMGLRISGLDLTAVKNKISGFSIVRADRDATILAQGLALPCLRDRAGSGSSTTKYTRPMHIVNQRWQQAPPSSGALGGTEFFGYRKEHSNESFYDREDILAYYAPDYDFDPSIVPTIQTGDRLKIVSSSFGKAYNNPTPSYRAGASIRRAFFTYYAWDVIDNVYKGGQHTINKQYQSKNNYHFNPANSTYTSYPSYLDEIEITNSITTTFGSQIVYNPSNPITLVNETHWRSNGEGVTENPEGYTASSRVIVSGELGGIYKGQEKPITYYQFLGWNNTNGALTRSVLGLQNYDSNQDGMMGGLLVNYTRPNTAVYGGLTEVSLEQTVFYSTGHFQPINNPGFNTPPLDVYNDIDVWGGDCYVDYLAFLRQYPRYFNNPNDGHGVLPKDADIAHGICMPYESTLNYAMRQAASVQEPMYANCAAKPQDTADQATYSGSTTPSPYLWINGLNNQPTPLIEEYNLNNVLTQREVVRFFSSEPQDFSLVTKYPVRWRYTGTKIYGDVIDYWREFLSYDKEDINGSYGQITSSTYFNNQIFSFQESAFGRLRASERTLINSTVGGLTTGTGSKLDGIDYISSEYGNQHQFSMVNSGRSIYWVDVDKKKSLRFAGDGRTSLSDNRGLHTFFKYECLNFHNKDSPAAGFGICGVFDYENNNVLWTFVRDYHKEIASDIIINSEDTVSDNYYSNNNTIFVTGNGGNIIFPETTWLLNDNVSSVYYVANKIGGLNILLGSANATTGVVSTIGTVLAGEYYEVKRNDNKSAWTATLVTLADISPARSTIMYNEDLNAFQGFFAFKPSFYFNYRNLFFSQDKDYPNIVNKIYCHNLNTLRANYYGQSYKSFINVNSNEEDYASKIFDSIRLNSNEKGYTDYSRFLFNTEKQYHYYDVQSDTRLKYLEDSIRMPIRTTTQKDRVRGKWVSFIFEFKNNDNIPVKLYNLITNQRISNRL